MLENERLKYICDQIERFGSVRLQELCTTLNTSGSTIRRDFEKLEHQGILKRVYGGAVSGDKQINPDISTAIDNRMKLNVDDKHKISQKCAELINDGDFVFIDGGSTYTDIIPYLEGKKITILTNNDLIRTNPDSSITVVVIGGRNLPEFRANVGPLALNFLKSVHLDKAFIGCGGLNTETLSVCTGEIDTAQIKEAAIARSKETYLAIDSSKIDVIGFYDFANVNDFTGVLIPENCVLENCDNLIYL